MVKAKFEQQDRTKKRLRTISTNRSQGPELGM
jgi:hypothetical protein